MRRRERKTRQPKLEAGKAMKCKLYSEFMGPCHTDKKRARPGSAPKWGGKKGEFRDWTTHSQVNTLKLL